MPGVGKPTSGRKRRTREETRLALLDAAAKVAISRVSEADQASNPLASVRITDALSWVNAHGGEPKGLAPMTTGAAYHIWQDQAAFQYELIEHMMNMISTPGADEIEELVHTMIARSAPADEVWRAVIDADFEASSASPELFLAVGLGALAPAGLVREAQTHANAVYAETLARLLSTVMAYDGRRLRAGKSMEDLIWATEALALGYLLRWRTHPEIATAVDDAGRTARSTAYLGLIEAFTEPSSD